MDKLSALSRGMQIMLGAGVLLLIDTFLPWQDFGDGELGQIAEELGADLSFSAWHGFWGWVMGLALIVLLAWLVVRVVGVELSLVVPETTVATVFAGIVFLSAVIKNLADDESTIWSYIGVALAAALAVGAWMLLQEAGGVEALRSEVSSMRPSTGAETPSPAASTEPSAQQPSPPAPPTTPPPPPAQPSPPPPGAAAPPTEPPPASSEPTH